MRQGQNPKRSRGRGRKPQNQLSRSLESNGPDVKIRGTSSHIYEKYQALARDAQTSGDRIGAENYLQHAEHYYRLIMTAQAQQEQNRQEQQNRHPGNGRSGDTEEEQGSEQQAAQSTSEAADAPADAESGDDNAADEKAADEKASPRRRAPRRRRPSAKADDAGDKPAPEDVTA